MTDLTRESLPAALQPEDVRLAKSIRQSAWFQEKRRSLGRNEFPTLSQVIALVDRVAALPSPAPEPPPIDDEFRDNHERAMRDHILEAPQDHVCDDLCSDYILDRFLGSSVGSGEYGRRAAQPAPDPEAIRLLSQLLNALEARRWAADKAVQVSGSPAAAFEYRAMDVEPLDVLKAAEQEARSFLHARSGRSQEEASEVSE